MSSGSSRWKLKPRPRRRAASTTRRGRRARRRSPSMPRASSTSSSVAIVGVHQLDAIAERRERRARHARAPSGRDRARSAASRRLEQRARVAAEADGAVDEQAAARRLQAARSTSAISTGSCARQIPNSDSARASSSVYGRAAASRGTDRGSRRRGSRPAPSTSTSPLIVADSRSRTGMTTRPCVSSSPTWPK